MPIVEKRMKYYRPQRDGTVRVLEEHVDHKGNIHFYGDYSAPSVEVADANLANNDMTWSLEAEERQELIEQCGAGQDIYALDYTNRDVTPVQGGAAIAKRFAMSHGADALPLAWWIEQLSPPQWTAICTELGWDTATKGARIQTRAIKLAGVADVFNDRE